MQVKDLFFYPINREITTVIKVDDRGEEQMAEELREYIPTEAIERELIRFLEAYVETRPGQPGAGTDNVGVWISGFFGSGKSHFAKIISYLLANPTVEGRTAHAWFKERVAGSPLAGEIEGLLGELRNYVESRPIVFQIKAEQDLINPDSITEIMYRQYLHSRGLSKTPWIGRFELGLIEMGVFDDFRRKIAELEGLAWEDMRDEHLLVRASTVRALRRALPERYPTDEAADKALDDVRDHMRLAPADLARELAAYVEKKDAADREKAFHVVFIIDEMGQFIGDDGQKLLELQSIAETFATQGGGRLWLLVTAQETLEAVVEGVQQMRTDYARIMDRFAIQIKLTSEDVEQVLEERILKKKEVVRPLLYALYKDHSGNLMDVAGLEASRPITTPDADSFFRTYPFLPYHFDLMQQAFASIRAKGGSTTQLTGGERSMLGVTQDVLAAPGVELTGAPVGRLVRLDQLYDQIVNEVPSSDRRAISTVAGQSHPGALHPVAALKALFILQHVDWVPATLDNVTRVLIGDVDTGLNQKREEVKGALAELVQQQYATESDGIYKYLSAVERDIEQEIAAEPVKNSEVRRVVRETLSDLLKTTGRLNYKGGTATFDFRIVGDGEEFRSQGDVTLEVYSPVYVEFGIADPELVRDVESPHQERTVYWLPDMSLTSVTNDFRRMIRIREVLRRRASRSDLDRVEASIIREKEGEIDRLKGRLQSALRRALVNGAIVYLGDETPLDGRVNTVNVIFNRELESVIPDVYTKFYLADVKVRESSIEEMLTVPSASLGDVEPDLHLWDTSGPEPRVNVTTSVVGEILAELETRRQRGEELSGSAITGHFEAVPYGWNPILVRIVLAALFRAGRITIEFEGKRYSDPHRKVAQDALTRKRPFGRALFYPEEGLSLEERRRAQQQLDLLFDRKVDDTPNTLATTLGQEVGALIDAGERLQLRTQAVNLPLKDLLYREIARAAEILGEPNQTAQIRAFLEAAGELRELVGYQGRVARFVEDGNLERFARSRALLTAVDRAQSYAEELQRPAILDRLKDVRHISSAREVVERWEHYRTCYNDLLRAYQEAYRRLFEKRSAVYSDIRDQLAQFTDAVPDLVTERIAENGPGYWSDDGLHYEGVRADLADIYLQIQGAEEVRAQAIRVIQREQDEERGEEEEHTKPSPVYVKLGDVVPHRTIETREQLQENVDALQREIGDQLDRGIVVILG